MDPQRMRKGSPARAGARVFVDAPADIRIAYIDHKQHGEIMYRPQASVKDTPLAMELEAQEGQQA
jgi:hypothetical protein